MSTPVNNNLGQVPIPCLDGLDLEPAFEQQISGKLTERYFLELSRRYYKSQILKPIVDRAIDVTPFSYSGFVRRVYENVILDAKKLPGNEVTRRATVERHISKVSVRRLEEIVRWTEAQQVMRLLTEAPEEFEI